jgi:hypothetical protein
VTLELAIFDLIYYGEAEVHRRCIAEGNPGGFGMDTAG